MTIDRLGALTEAERRVADSQSRAPRPDRHTCERFSFPGDGITTTIGRAGCALCRLEAARYVPIDEPDVGI